MTISRKQFFKDTAKYFVGATAAVLGSNVSSIRSAYANIQTHEWPWPYSPLDPEYARKLAHDCFYESGCSYAGFSGLLKPLQEKIGEPFASIPPQMMSYGGAGVKGWGTLCGTLNGVSAAVSLVCDPKSSSAIINELMSWYAQTRLPTDKSNEYGETGRFQVDKKIKEMSQSRSGSPLCHISVTRWCRASGLTADSPERFERCARLSGDVAAQAILLLNEQAEEKFEAKHAISANAFECNKCHGPKGDEANVLAKMDCVQCHGEPHK
jgi:hypothetical protein